MVADFPVIQRPWRGYEDRGLPVGMWIAQGSVLGDASGGSQDVRIVFKGEDEPLGARFFNVEQLEAHDTRTANISGSLDIENFDIVSSTGLIDRRIHLSLDTDAITNTALVTGDVRLPLFLGRPQLVGIIARLVARTPNVLNETFFFTAQGYIWEPRSLLLDGGLRRPLDSLYGG